MSVQADHNISMLSVSILGIALRLLSIIAVSQFYLLFTHSHRGICSRLCRVLPSEKQTAFTMIASVILYHWPSLLEYPITEIWTTISCSSWFWEFASGRCFDNECISLGDNLERFAGLLGVPLERYDRVFRRGAFVLEKREDRSLWVMEFELGVFTGEVVGYPERVEVIESTTGSDELVDLVDVKSKFTTAPDFVPAAPWRVVGSHFGPIQISSSPPSFISSLLALISGKKTITMSPLNSDRVPKHFFYSRSHDPEAEVGANIFARYTQAPPFWNSSAESQSRAWFIIDFLSQHTFFAHSCPPGKEFYDQFGMKSYMAELNAVADLEHQEFMEWLTQRMEEPLPNGWREAGRLRQRQNL